MVKVNDFCYMKVEFDGLEDFNFKMFERFTLHEQAGLIIPMFELVLFQTDYSLYRSIIKTNLKIKISYGSEIDSVKTHEFSLLNYVYVQTNKGYKLSLTGILNVKDFTNKIGISANKEKSNNILSSLKTVKPIIDYEGDDKQVWIRHNCTEKDFAERVIKHAYIEEKDLVMSALTVKKELIVKGYKKSIKAKETLEFKEEKENESPDKIRIDGFQLESDSAIWSNFLSEGRQLPVVSAKDRKMELIKPTQGSLKNSKSYQEQLDNVHHKPLLDNGNCHDNYYKAWLNNLNYFVQLIRNNVYINISKSFLDNNDLKLLDTVKFTPDNPNNQDFVDSISGKYILTEKITEITQKGFKHTVRINRDYNL